MNANGYQANETGVDGLGAGFSHTKGHIVVGWTILKSLFFPEPLMDNVCHVYEVIWVTLGPK